MLITWQQRNLSLYGKINIVKTLGISKLIYSASLLPVPDHYIQEINKLIFNFIWVRSEFKVILILITYVKGDATRSNHCLQIC